MAQSRTFKVKILCGSGGGPPHQQELEIGPAKWAPLGARSEGTCEMQYTCPVSGEDRKVVVDCRPDFPRPYHLVSVT